MPAAGYLEEVEQVATNWVIVAIKQYESTCVWRAPDVRQTGVIIVNISVLERTLDVTCRRSAG
jgi:hypothetical protein